MGRKASALVTLPLAVGSSNSWFSGSNRTDISYTFSYLTTEIFTSS